MDDVFASFDPTIATHEQLVAFVLELARRFGSLEQENQRLREENVQLKEENRQLRQELERRGGPPPWVKPNTPNAQLAARKAKEKNAKAAEKKQRKPRSEAFTRKRQEPTEIVYHAPSHCPDCQRALAGGWEHTRRQVIEIPQTPVRVIDHVLIARHCGVCHKRCLSTPDLSEYVVGKHRLGVTLMSLVGLLKTVCRLPIRTIRSLLQALYGVSVSNGEIVETLHLIAQKGEGVVSALKEQLRASPFSHADETGWRQDGRNGYLWSFSTPRLRYFHYDHSRAGSVAQEVYGESFAGIVVSDFYGGYNAVSGTNQRCWVHLLRDAHKLREAHPSNKDVQDFVDALVVLYREAITYQQECRRLSATTPHAVTFGDTVLQRRDKRRQFESRLSWLAQPYLENTTEAQKLAHPQSVLAQRLDRFACELFVFVEHPQVPSENNAAERAIRPCVIARKISGGTRSPKGSQTLATLMSLFGTWTVQGNDPWRQCQRMLQAKTGCSADA